MNLHAIARSAIGTVNPEYLGVWKQSTGFGQDPTGRPIPTYNVFSNTRFQVQHLSGRDLVHTDFISQQGVKRTVYAFGNITGVVRPDGTGGDLLQFPENRGGSNRTWLVTHVLETYSPDTAGWCRVGVVLQPDVTPP